MSWACKGHECQKTSAPQCYTDATYVAPGVHLDGPNEAHVHPKPAVQPRALCIRSVSSKDKHGRRLRTLRQTKDPNVTEAHSTSLRPQSAHRVFPASERTSSSSAEAICNDESDAMSRCSMTSHIGVRRKKPLALRRELQLAKKAVGTHHTHTPLLKR
jgi:hypothetical protein